jgi:hypothetical protein
MSTSPRCLEYSSNFNRSLRLNPKSTMDNYVVSSEELQKKAFYLLGRSPNPGSQKPPPSHGIPAPIRTSKPYPSTPELLAQYIKRHSNSQADKDGNSSSSDGGFVSIFENQQLLRNKLRGYCTEKDNKDTWTPGKGSGWRMYFINGEELFDNDANVLKLSKVVGLQNEEQKESGEHLVWGTIPRAAVVGSLGWEGPLEGW